MKGKNTMDKEEKEFWEDLKDSDMGVLFFNFTELSKKEFYQLAKSHFQPKDCLWKACVLNGPVKKWWSTSCGGDVKYKNKFCPYCGGKIINAKEGGKGE